jgi:hypothetical protein
MASTKLWKTFTNMIVEKTLTIGQGGRIVQKNADGTSAAYNSGSEILTATRTVRPEESGKTFFLGAATEFVTTLPLPALGLQYRFIVKAAPVSASYTIVTSAAATIIKGQVYTLDVNSATDPDLETSGQDVITLVDGKAVAGDSVELFCDGTNWFMRGYCSVFDAITIS